MLNLVIRPDGTVLRPDGTACPVVCRQWGNQVNIPTPEGRRTAYIHSLMARKYFPSYNPRLHVIKFLDGNHNNPTLENLVIVRRTASQQWDADNKRRLSQTHTVSH